MREESCGPFGAVLDAIRCPPNQYGCQRLQYVRAPSFHNNIRVLTSDTNNHDCDFSRDLPHARDSDFVPISLSIPVRKKVEYNLRCLLPYKAVVRLAKGARNNLAMATPLFTFGCDNIGTKDRE